MHAVLISELQLSRGQNARLDCERASDSRWTEQPGQLRARWRLRPFQAVRPRVDGQSRLQSERGIRHERTRNAAVAVGATRRAIFTRPVGRTLLVLVLGSIVDRDRVHDVGNAVNQAAELHREQQRRHTKQRNQQQPHARWTLFPRGETEARHLLIAKLQRTSQPRN